MVLDRVVSSYPDEWEQLKKQLDGFGAASGLFHSVRVRRLGEQAQGDPFQIRIRISGGDTNLVDVGYGVSQVLPIIVDCLREPEQTTFLMQQPEVHLHPKAQAALASFLGQLSKVEKKRFLIETHSDHIIDRFRMEVRDGNLDAKDVSILYFERSNGSVRIHPIELDEFGNLSNPPRTYRSFFLEEEKRLLGA